ncbi:PPE domain-containing protein [Rhodococcus pyridinivorans]|uniref:PPE domain-containing protein n=1 Tax=Rhodococcus pyridinivorans TaxID=103816 RepID=UPI00265B0748|nr:PPE domain-containing protein [Rhodococcus pyridinivorans]
MGTEPWGLYPPEINAGRYESGVGPAQWVAAAAEWTAMAAMVTEAIAALGLQVGSITGDWEGAASQRFGVATTPYAAWLTEMVGIATLNSQRSIGVVQAYLTGRAAMVPLAAIVLNRAAARTAQVAGALGAPNTEMVRLEIEYSAFWSHNASVMAAYDAAVTAATTPTPIKPPPSLVVDGATGVASQPLQHLGQQVGQAGANPLASGPSVPSGFMNKYAGPSLSNSSTLAQLFGSGAGSGDAFGGRGAGASAGGAAIGVSASGTGFSSAAGGFLAPPLASFSPANAATSVGHSGPAFGGVQNSPTTPRPAMPMAPPMGRGSRLQQDLDERERETVVAANQEFVITPPTETGPGLAGQEKASASELR